MAGTVIDNLAHQRTWHEGLGQAATAGAVTGFVSGSIAGFSACREAASKAAEASKAAKTSVEQIGSRAAEVAPTKALCKVRAACLVVSPLWILGVVIACLSCKQDSA
jgi:hypothetical protein